MRGNRNNYTECDRTSYTRTNILNNKKKDGNKFKKKIEKYVKNREEE